MQHPEIIVIPGKDLTFVLKELDSINIIYTIKQQKPEFVTQLLVGPYNCPIEKKSNYYLKTLKKGLTLPFFNLEPVKLTWDIDINEWSFDTWKTIIEDDVSLWFSKDPNIAISNEEKSLMTTVINNRIFWETETLRNYTEILMPIFQHPDIQNMLYTCAIRKDSHVNMWCQLKEKLKLPGPDIVYDLKKMPPTILDLAIINLANVVGAEEIPNSAATIYLNRLTNKGHFSQFIKLVQRRDNESRQNSKVLLTLLEQISKMYPYFKKLIKHAYINAQNCAIFRNRHLQYITL